jgi:serine/threonine protein kinase
MRRRTNKSIVTHDTLSMIKAKIVQKSRKRRKAVRKLQYLNICLCLIAILVFMKHFMHLSIVHNKTKATRADRTEMKNKTPQYSIHFDSEEERICEPLVHLSTHTNCNIIHEFNLDHIDAKLVSHGYIREVWQVIDEKEENFALKTLLHDKRFTSSQMDGQALDAKISDQLQKSEYIANIYAYCGYAGLYDYSSEGNLEDHYQLYNKRERIQAAVDIAKGLADLHNIRGNDQTAFIHNDIAIRQFILLNGRYKLNDFNTARPLYWNSKVNAVCPDVTNRFVDKNRSPEEMRDKINYVDEKIDVYSLGNIFYKLIMNERKYDDLSTNEAAKLILKGHIPEVKVKHKVDLILKHAMVMCLQLDPVERSSASEVHFYLANELKKINM